MSPERVTIPVFPLPNLVFFPRTVLPLHIFEPRYKEMVADALGGDLMIGVAQLRPGWDKDYYGQPPVYRVLGVGRIIGNRRWPDGRYDIVLEGMYRAQIVSESMCKSYRVAEAEILSDVLPEEKRSDLEREYPSLLRILRQLVIAVPDTERIIAPEVLDNPSIGELVDLLACTFVENAYEKQSILSETDVSRRLRLTKVQIKAALQSGREE